MAATLSPSRLLELEDVNGAPNVGDVPVWRPAVGPGGAAGFVFEPAGAGGGGGITRIQDADDVDAAGLGPGKGLLFDDVAGKFLIVDLATQVELAAEAAARVAAAAAHVAAADPHPGYRLESIAITAGDLSFDPATQAELDAEVTARAAGDAGRQPLDADLTALAGLDSATAGMAATDGAGWIKKTYAQVKTALGLVKADVGLGNVDNTSDVNKPVSTAQQAAIDAEAAARAAGDALLIPLTQRGAASGVATLDSGGKIPTGQLPPLAISNTFVVASQAAMLALTAETGDVAVRSDTKTTFILRGADPTVLADWELLQTPTDLVLSVAGKTGAVTLVEGDIAGLVADLAARQPLDADLTTIAALDAATAGMIATDGAGWIRKTYAQVKTALTLVKGDVGLGNVDNTSDVNKPVSTAQQTAIDGKQPLDADLTAIAALDATTAGAIASDGAGWIKKTYAQFKTALVLVKGDVGLGNVDNTSDAAKPISTATQTALDAKQDRQRVSRPSTALYETFSRLGSPIVNKTVLVSQKLVLQMIELPSGLTIASITFWSGTTALGGGNHQIFGLFDDNAGGAGGAARALLRGTADDGATAWAANSPKTLNLTTPYATTHGGYFYLGLLVDATTVPTLLVVSVQANVCATAPAISGAGQAGLTALPAAGGNPTGGAEVLYATVN